MKIIELILKYFLSTEQGQSFKPILELLQKNDFDLNKIIKNFDISSLLPLLSTFLGNPNSAKAEEKPPLLTPIKGVADKDIIDSLNTYFASGE